MPRLLPTLAVIVVTVAIVSPLLLRSEAALPVDVMKFKSTLAELLASKSAAAVDAEVGKLARAAMTKVNVESLEAVALAEKKLPDALWAELMPGVTRKSLSADREALVVLAGLAQSGRPLPRAEIDALAWSLREKIQAKIELTAEDRALAKVLTAKFRAAPEGRYVVEGEQYVFQRSAAATAAEAKPIASAATAAPLTKPSAVTAMVKFITLSKRQLQEAADRELARLRKLVAARADGLSGRLTYGATSVIGEDARGELARGMKSDYMRELEALKKETPDTFAQRRGLPDPVPIKVLNPTPSAEDLKAATDLVSAQRAALLKKEAEAIDDYEKWSVMSWRYDQDARAARNFQQGNVGRHQLVNLDPYANVNEASMQIPGARSRIERVRREIALQDRLTAEQVAQSRLPIAVAGKVAPVVELSKAVADDALALARTAKTITFAPKAVEMRNSIPRSYTNVLVNGKTQAQYIAALEKDFNSASAAMATEAKRVAQYAKECAAATTEADAKRIAKLIEESRDKMRAYHKQMQEINALPEYDSVRVAYAKARAVADEAQLVLFKQRRDELDAAITKFKGLRGADEKLLAWLRSKKPAAGGEWDIVVAYDPAAKLAELEASVAARNKALEDSTTLYWKLVEADKHPSFRSGESEAFRSDLMSKAQSALNTLQKAFAGAV